MNDNNGILLKGLDGSNPLAFLAALGTLRTLTLSLPTEAMKMSWELCEGAWRPRLNILASAEKLILLLTAALKSNRTSHPTSFVGNDDQISSFYRVARSGGTFSEGLDQWITALTSDVHPTATSRLQLTRRDYFAGNLDQIMVNTTPESLHHTLFQRWRYDDRLSGQSLHIEATEDRRHAYQWHQPSGDPNRNKCGNMLGANRLAIEAIPLFLGFPSKNPERLSVTGWTGVRSDDSRWTWPIWSSQIPVSVVRSLIAWNELQKEKPDMGILRERGVHAAYRCRRILVEKTPNLTPAIAIG